MKYRFLLSGQYIPWLLLLFVVDAFAALLLWLTDAEMFISVVFVILLFTGLLFFCVCAVLVRSERKKEQAFWDFLENPQEYQEAELVQLLPLRQGRCMHALGKKLRNEKNAYAKLAAQMQEYEEYVESWAHEIKTPLSLLAFLSDNHRDELLDTVNFKLDYILNRMQESVDQMLFYARLKGIKKDYRFEQIEILKCVEEVLEDYKPLLDEKEFRLSINLSEETVCTDRRGIRFLLGQIVSNSVKYCKSKPELSFRFGQKDGFFILEIRDNGIGVKACDLPYIFEKGFTGDSGENRKKATGMGLYLARGIAEDMNLSLEADSRWQEGFEMRIYFPVLNQQAV